MGRCCNQRIMLTRNRIIRGKLSLVNKFYEVFDYSDLTIGNSAEANIAVAYSPSQRVAPPRITESPVSFECDLHTQLDFKTRRVMIGQIAWMHVRNGIIDPSNMRRIDNAYRPAGRLYANRYCRTRHEFPLDNSGYAEIAAKFSK